MNGYTLWYLVPSGQVPSETDAYPGSVNRRFHENALAGVPPKIMHKNASDVNAICLRDVAKERKKPDFLYIMILLLYLAFH